MPDVCIFLETKLYNLETENLHIRVNISLIGQNLKYSNVVKQIFWNVNIYKMGKVWSVFILNFCCTIISKGMQNVPCQENMLFVAA